jgi:hypothetical protein
MKIYFRRILGLASFLAFCSLVGAQTTNGVVGLWHGEGNAQDAVGTNHGVLIRSVLFAPGVYGQSFQFDGASFVQIADSPSLDLGNELSIEMWFKRDSNLPFDTAFTLLDKRDGAVANYGANMSQNYGFQLYYNDGSGFAISSSFLPSGGEWHHFVGSYRQQNNGVELITFIDGVAIRTNSLPGNMSAAINNAPLSVGAAGNGSADFFKGLIDEVTLYNRALGSAEVASHFSVFELKAVLLTRPFKTGSSLRFQVNRIPSRPYVVEVSTNLVDWTEIQTTRSTNVLGIFVTHSNAFAAQAFYRLRSTN